MNEALWFRMGGEHVRETIESALAWCQQCIVVTDGQAAREGEDLFWSLLTRSVQSVRAVIFSNPAAANADVLATFQATGRLRCLSANEGPRGHLIAFENGGNMRVLIAPAPLSAGTVTGAGIWCFWSGAASAVPDGLQSILDACWTASEPVGPDVSASEIGLPPRPEPYSRPIPSVREVLNIRSIRSFFDLDAEEQARALWSALIGEGAVDLDHAIRSCAERLRAQGFLEYHLLRQDGRVYAAIEERLLEARRATTLFDRPRNGFVRAIQSSVDELTAEQWRDCIINALPQGERIDRDHAVRLGFQHAQSVYGVDAQRLRSGGRADQALRSAINSGIRQGYLARDGAAYLTRIADLAVPTVRGTLTPADSEAPGSAPPGEGPLADLQPLPEAAVAAPDAPGPVPDAAGPVPDAAVAVPEAAAPAPERPATESAVSLQGSPPAPAAQEPTQGPSVLDRKLYELDLPTRALNWAERQGIETVRELLAWDPDAFMKERNVGRRTVSETREHIEALLGQTWEEARRALLAGASAVHEASQAPEEEAVDSATELLTAGGGSGWARLAAGLTDEQRAFPLSDVPLPTRMKNFVRAEGLDRVGELFAISYAALAQRDNLGRKTLNDTLDAVREFLREQSTPPAHKTFIESWYAQLAVLEPIPRMIVTRRAGMLGTREKLEELGVMLGVSRERVRQIEMGVIGRIRERSRWRRSVEEHLSAAFGPGRAIPLELLAEDPWWAGITGQELLLEYVVSRVFESELFLLKAPSGTHYLARFPSEDLQARLENAKQRVAKLEFPVDAAAIDLIVRDELEGLDPILYQEFEAVLDAVLQVDPERPGQILGYGRSRQAEVIAFLNTQEAPVPIAIVEERCGRGALPDEVLYFKRGVIGLKRHFPDFDGWMERLVPPALELMKERPAGRQWLVTEIHDVLQERGLVPEWLGHWQLASLLRLSGKVDYLGRLRIAEKDSAHEERIQYEDLLEQLLRDAGAPLAYDELLRRARERTDIPDQSASILTREAPFVRLDDSHIGLVDRDIPGGAPAIAAAVESIVEHLTTTKHGLTLHLATELVRRLSPSHADWTQQLVASVLRSEPTIRIDHSRNIGLDDWDDARCPARAEFIRREVQRAGGTMPLPELCRALEATYGRAPDRSTLGVLVREVGLTIDGDLVSRPSSAVPGAPEALQPDVQAPIVPLEGIPAELRDMFEELVKEPFWSVGELRAQVDEHVASLAQEHQVNEFVDLQGAHDLARQCQALLDRWETFPIPDRRLAHAAIRYFVSWQDVEHDLGVGGLDDDKAIMNAVLAHLGMENA